MNSSDAPLVYQLLKDYHETAQHLKALRRLKAAQSSDPSWVETSQDVNLGETGEAAIERHRAKATGWFNAVGTLYLRGLIDQVVFRAIAEPRAAQLWCELVADLDREVRRSAGGDKAADVMPMVERLWREYAEGRLPTLQFVFAPTVQAPALVN